MKTISVILLGILSACASNQYARDWDRFMASTPHEYCWTPSPENPDRAIWFVRFGSLEECKAWVPMAQARHQAEQMAADYRESMAIQQAGYGISQIGCGISGAAYCR